MFQVAGMTGNGVLQAACEQGIWGIGVDVDQFVSTPDTAKCTFVSAEKKLKKNVSDAIAAHRGTAPQGGSVKLDITTEDVGLSAVPRLREPGHAEIQAGSRCRGRGPEGRARSRPCEEDQFGGCVRSSRRHWPSS